MQLFDAVLDASNQYNNTDTRLIGSYNRVRQKMLRSNYR